MNPAYEKFDTNGDCRECGYHITWHALQAGNATCPKPDDRGGHDQGVDKAGRLV